MNTPWHKLIAETAQIRRTPLVERDSVLTYVSAFQVPEALREIEDPEFFTFEFQYMDEGEGTKDIKMGDGTKVTVGKQSGRVFALHIPKVLVQEALRAHLAKSTIAANTVHALASMTTNERPRHGHLDNYRVTETLFRENGSRFG